MKRAILSGVLTLGLVAAGLPAEAGDRYHYGHGYSGYKHHHHHKRHHKRRGNDNLLIAAGIVGGAVLLGSLLSYRPYSPPPPRVVYVPAYRPTCYQDQVYRYLPDGRIQWGTRTRCY